MSGRVVSPARNSKGVSTIKTPTIKGERLTARLPRQLIFGLVWFGLLAACAAAAARDNPDWLSLVLPGGRRSGLFARSLGLSAVAAVADLILGVVIASAFWSWGKRMRWVRWLPLVLGVLPPYIHALAWCDILQTLAYRVPGDLAAAWVMAMAYLPAGVGIGMLSLETVSRQPVDAARIWRSDLSVLLRVLLPLAAPMLAAGWIFLFLINLMDYSVPSLFGVNVYALEMFAEYSATSQPGRAFLLSMPLIVLAGALLPVLRNIVRFSGQSQVWSVSPWSTPPSWPGGFVFLQRAALGIWLFQFGAPLAILIKLGFLGAGSGLSFAPAAADLGFSFGVAAAAAALSLPLIWILMEASHTRSALEWLLILPLALPAPLVGTAMAALFNQPFLSDFYNSAWMPILAGLLRFAAFGVFALLAQSRRIDPLLFDAARVFQSKFGQGLFHVRLPLLAPGLIAAGCLVFALTLGELGATLIVIPPGYSTLSLRIYNYLHYGASDIVAQLCLVVLALTLVSGIGAALALNQLGRRENHKAAEEP